MGFGFDLAGFACRDRSLQGWKTGLEIPQALIDQIRQHFRGQVGSQLSQPRLFHRRRGNLPDLGHGAGG